VLDGRYRLLRVLGEGGMGTVWAAEHLLLGKLVAVKLLLPQHVNDGTRARFEREARMASALHHPSVVKIYDLGYAPDGSPYLVMEYLKGQSLADRIEARGRLSLRESLFIMEHVLSGLSAAHQKGIVHRDLKPDNVFLAQQDSGRVRAQLLDFGISKDLEETSMALTRTGAVLGTPYYLAPEQARGERGVDHRVDVWAAGVLLYEMLTGNPPFVADNYNALLIQILMEDPVPPSRLRPDLPPEVDAIALRALERDRELRFESAEAMSQELRRLSPTQRVRTRPRLTSEEMLSMERPIHRSTADGNQADEVTEVSDSFSFSLLRRSLSDTFVMEDAEGIDIDIDIVFESEPESDVTLDSLAAAPLRPRK